MLAPVRTEAPGTDLVSLDEVRAHVPVGAAGTDALLSSLIAAATAYLDGYSGVLGRCLVNQTWRASYCSWPARGEIELPFPNVSAVTVKYSDFFNVEQTADASLYQLIERPIGSCIVLRPTFQWPSLYPYRADPVRVDLTAGYGTASDVPQSIKQAALLIIGNYYWAASKDPTLSLERVDGVIERRWIMSEVSFKPVEAAIDALLAPYRRRRM